MPTPAEEFARRYVDDLVGVLRALPLEPLGRALDALEGAYREGRQVFLAGNGGSAATASHLCNDLVWGVARLGVPGVRAIALSDNVPLMTAIANDTSYAEIFVPHLSALGREGDLLIAISGSGNSPNVLRVVERAREMRMKTVGFLGFDGGRLRDLVDVPVVVPSNDYGPIEDAHMMFDHLAIAYLRTVLRP